MTDLEQFVMNSKIIMGRTFPELLEIDNLAFAKICMLILQRNPEITYYELSAWANAFNEINFIASWNAK